MTPAPPESDPSFEFEPRNKVFLFEANRAIAEREARPKYLITFASEVDLSEVERVGGRSTRSAGPAYAAFVIKGVALALREFPQANRRVCRRGWWPFARRQIQKFRGRDVAVSVGRESPGDEGAASLEVIRDADVRTLGEITGSIVALAARGASATAIARRSRFLGLAERLPARISTPLLRLTSRSPRAWARYWGGAARVTPPASYGGDAGPGAWAYSIEASFGPIQLRPVVRDSAVVARPAFTLTMDFDRRVMPGAQAAQFFRKVVDLLEHAEAELGPFAESDALPTAPGRDGEPGA